MIPFSLGGALMSVISGFAVSRIGRYRPVIWFAWSMMLLGYGLMTMLGDKSNKCAYMSFFYLQEFVSTTLLVLRKSCTPWSLPLALDACSRHGAILLLLYQVIDECLQTPLIGLQASMPLKDMATSTGAFVFIRFACTPFIILHNT